MSKYDDKDERDPSEYCAECTAVTGLVHEPCRAYLETPGKHCRRCGHLEACHAREKE